MTKNLCKKNKKTFKWKKNNNKKRILNINKTNNIYLIDTKISLCGTKLFMSIYFDIANTSGK